MEHRHNSRARTDLKVIIYNKGLPVAVGKTKNISREGLFVRTVYGEVTLHQPLEIQFVPTGQRCPSRIRVKTCVAHKTSIGFGLALVDNSDVAREGMKQLLDIETDRIEFKRSRPRISA
ncbi:MAG TPA: PilZ domain-containing protein [Spongiibacteraceae bacterium]|nr:PilZ domain-containing protein [Spongiibacteraceae bacterium]